MDCAVGPKYSTVELKCSSMLPPPLLLDAVSLNYVELSPSTTAAVDGFSILATHRARVPLS